MKNNQLRKALDTIALKHAEGVVSNDILIKACENYKQKIGFVEDFDYDMLVAKSAFDAINGVEQDVEIAKAVLPGQTKMVDGVMLVFTATPNAKTDYDWRVVKKGAAGTKPVGRGSKLTDKQIADKQKFINALFPKDLSSVTVVKQLGGSTGAKLVQDANGNQYVMKKGSNTNNGHVKSEYLANQLYGAMGMRVPDYELYEENGESVLLSRYIPMTRQPNAKDHAEMAKGWIADIVLANWDVYQNDNCLIDSSGRVIRVDNGGCLDYRAQGSKKVFDTDVMRTHKDMIKYNQGIYAQLNPNDILQQIAVIQSKKSDVVGYLNLSGNQAMAQVISQRIDNLNDIANHIKKQQRLNKPNPVPRKVKSPKDMYRDLTDDELDDLWKNAQGANGRQKLNYTGAQGWDLLSAVCKIRGYDVRPRVVDDNEYWKHVAALPKDMPMMFRGVASRNGIASATYVNMFKHDDDCFYGNIGIYGEGIYAHINDGNQSDQTRQGYTNSRAYKDAVNYAGGDPDGVVMLAYEKGSKIVDTQDLIAEIKKNPPIAANTANLQKEANQIKDDIDKATDTLNNLSENTRNQIKQDMHYDEQAVQDMQLEIDNTDWGAVDDNGDPDYPKWADFVEHKMCDWVKANGGTVTPDKGQLTFKLPNSKKEFTITQYTYERHNSIKRKSPFHPAYSYPVEMFRDWFMREHVNKVDSAIKSAIDGLGDTVNQLQVQIKDLSKKYSDKMTEIKQKSCPDPNNSIYEAIYDAVINRGSMEELGIYAALKGYDGLYQKNGNGSGHGYAIILNRSRLVVKQ
jgi:hypothetical protein